MGADRLDGLRADRDQLVRELKSAREQAQALAARLAESERERGRLDARRQDLQSRLNDVEWGCDRADRASVLLDRALGEADILRQRVAWLEAEKLRLEQELGREAAVIELADVGEIARRSLDALGRSVRGEGGCAVERFELELKSGIQAGPDGIRLVSPKAGELTADSLSTVRIGLRPMARIRIVDDGGEE